MKKLALLAFLVVIPAVASANSGDFAGAVAIGSSYAGAITAPTNGLSVQGVAVIGSSAATTGTALDLGSNTSSLLLPVGTTGTRPGTATNGMVRYNSTTPAVEAYVNNAWTSLATGSGGGTIFLGPSATANNPQISGDATSGLFTPVGSTVAIATGGSERLRVTSAGLVGIGTTNPVGALDVAPSGSPSILIRDGANSNGTIKIGNAGGINYIESGAAYSNGSAADLYFTPINSGTTWMTIKSTGLVGIGTTNPVGALDVAPSGSPSILIRDGANSNGTIKIGNAGGINYIESGAAYSNGSAADLYFTPINSGTTWMTIKSTGLVGIGTTNPDRKLTVSGSGDVITKTITTSGSGNSASLWLQGGGTNATWQIITNRADLFSSVDNLAFYKGAGTTGPKMVITDSGNVGIGTTNPDRNLTVSGSGDVITKTITTSGSGNSASLWIQGGGTNAAWQILTNRADLFSSVDNLAFYKSGGTIGPKMVITDSGNVGIGTTNPDRNLTVSGSGDVISKTVTTSGSGNSAALLIQGGGTNAAWQIITNRADLFSSADNLAFYKSAGTTGAKMVITDAGNVGIGTTVPAVLLHVGSGSASGAVQELQNSSGACTHTPGASSETVSCSSDARLKTNINNSAHALGWLDDMQVRDFTVKATGEKRTGVVAQEVMLKHPEMVHEDAGGLYTVDQPNPWVLVKTIQELHTLILEQQIEIDALKKSISELKR